MKRYTKRNKKYMKKYTKRKKGHTKRFTKRNKRQIQRHKKYTKKNKVKVGGKLNEKIIQYLDGIRGNRGAAVQTRSGDTTGSAQRFKLNGAEVNCFEQSGAYLLANKIVYIEKEVRKIVDDNDLPMEGRSETPYVGHGAFGMVFKITVGAPNKDENMFAIKIIDNVNSVQLITEFEFQLKAAEIAPQVYDYFLYKCEDGKTRGFIIMQYLKGYIPGYKMNELLQKDLELYQKSGMEKAGESLYRDRIRKINALLAGVNGKLEELNIDLPDFERNFMLKMDLTDIKALDYGLAQHRRLTEEKP
jgi:hypothetical protein